MENIKTYQHASIHTKEIQALLNSVKYPGNTNLIFQSLPKHMRRRAMSHYPKRLPKIYRKAHLSQMKKSGKLVQQCKTKNSKKSRRNINRKKIFLLNTHIWHSKRFFMVQKWNCKIPYSPSEKSFRACYRAVKSSCLIQDISYYNCIEINGFLKDIKDRFQLLTNKSGLGLCAKTFTSGGREGHITLFQKEAFPRGALGEVSFLWRPSKQQNVSRTLWIWIHPSSYSAILNEIIKTLELVKSKDENILNNESNIKHDYENKNANLFLLELKRSFNRFRLYGPLSQSILFKILKPSKISRGVSDNWFSEEVKHSFYEENHNLQTQFWESCTSEDILPNMIISLNVEDPRNLKSLESIKGEQKVEEYINFQNRLCDSFLWSSTLRRKLNKFFITDSEYNKIVKKTTLVPTENMYVTCLQTVPVIIIQNPGSYNSVISKLGHGTGWDIIIPNSYGLIFWQSLLSCGVRVGGLREMESIFKESGKDMFLPDTISGKIENEERFLVLKSRHLKKPPNKRCSYDKICISSPFKLPFNELVNEWSLLGSKEHFYVLREQESLEQIIKSLSRKIPFPNLESGCLIQIYIKMEAKGNLEDLSIVCIPSKGDLKNAVLNNVVYIEPLESYKYFNRKASNKAQGRLLKVQTLKTTFKRKCNQKMDDPKKQNIIKNAKFSFEKVSELCVVENPKCVRQQCTREVIGYVKNCTFSFVHSKVVGIAYVAAEGLKKLLNTSEKPNKILVRRKTSRNYHVANFEIPVNV